MNNAKLRRTKTQLPHSPSNLSEVFDHEYSRSLDRYIREPQVGIPLSTLIRDQGLGLAGLVAAHYWLGRDLAIGRASEMFPQIFHRQIAEELIGLAPETTFLPEVLTVELFYANGPSRIIDLAFDADDDSPRTVELAEELRKVSEHCEEPAHVNSAGQSLRDWRRNIRQHFLGACIDWIDL